MNEYRQVVKESFDGMETEEVLRRVNSGTLTKDAMSAASEVLEGRKAELREIVSRSIAAERDNDRRAKFESVVKAAERLPLPPEIRTRLWRTALFQSILAYAAIAAVGALMWWLYIYLQPRYIAIRAPIKALLALPFLPLLLPLLPIALFFDGKARYIREQVKKAKQCSVSAQPVAPGDAAR